MLSAAPSCLSTPLAQVRHARRLLQGARALDWSSESQGAGGRGEGALRARKRNQELHLLKLQRLHVPGDRVGVRGVPEGVRRRLPAHATRQVAVEGGQRLEGRARPRRRQARRRAVECCGPATHHQGRPHRDRGHLPQIVHRCAAVQVQS